MPVKTQPPQPESVLVDAWSKSCRDAISETTVDDVCQAWKEGDGNIHSILQHVSTSHNERRAHAQWKSYLVAWTNDPQSRDRSLRSCHSLSTWLVSTPGYRGRGASCDGAVEQVGRVSN